MRRGPRSSRLAHLDDVRAKIADLKVMERVLKETVARCGEGSGSGCPLIEALHMEHARRVGFRAGTCWG
jgi:MerR family transcriptional regulator, mercuric resistance operon regulatory protein